MTKYEIIKKIKEEQKQLASEIREKKKWRKNPPKSCKYCISGFVPELITLKYTYRHQHIAYCELRGRERHQIEVPAPDNLPNDSYIEKIKNEWLSEVSDEVICNYA